MSRKTFHWLLFALLIVLMPMYILIGLVPTGSLLIESLHSVWSPARTGHQFIWMNLVLSTIGVALCAVVAFALSRFVYWFQGKSRDVVGFAVVLAAIVTGALPIYGVSVHGPAQFQNAFSLYAQQFARNSL